jgi:putative oxidoreductase
MRSMVVAVSFNSTAMNVTLLLAHLFLGLMIFTHGYRKVFRGGKLSGTGRWFESIGVRPGLVNAYAAAFTEIGAGVLLTIGLLTSLASAAVIALMAVAMVTVHRKNGFMITNPGGGIEYCLANSVIALALGTFGSGEYSLDHVWGVFAHWTANTAFLVTLAVGFASAGVQLLATYRPPKNV